MDYSGYVVIDFHIERIKDLTSDEYRVVSSEDDVNRIEELVLEIEGRSYFSSGRFSGLPENCYPDEGDTEILSIKWNGKVFPWSLTSEEESIVLENIENAVQDCDGGPDSSLDFDEFSDY